MLLYHFVLKLLKQQVKNIIISSNSGKHSLVPQRQQITQDFLPTISSILRIQCIWLSCLLKALIAWMFG